MITYVTGDLLASDEPVIAHGCNTQGVMGAGIAGLIARKWPEVERTYATACRLRAFPLGACYPIWLVDEDRYVLNLATQRFPGKDGSYWAIMLAMGNAVEWAVSQGITRIAIPRIGCGIAGLEWPRVEWVIDGILNEWVKDGPEVVVYTLEREEGKFG